MKKSTYSTKSVLEKQITTRHFCKCPPADCVSVRPTIGTIGLRSQSVSAILYIYIRIKCMVLDVCRREEVNHKQTPGNNFSVE